MPDERSELTETDFQYRVHLARYASYRLFFKSKSADDVYFTPLLNIFVALAQYPLNFALYARSEADEYSPISHYCTDKNHQKWFEGYIHRLTTKGHNDENFEKFLFPIFPEISSKFFVSVHLMETKAVPKQAEAIARPDQTFRVDSKVDYIARCAERYFETPWSSFGTRFAVNFADGVEQSIIKIAQNHRWIHSKLQKKAETALSTLIQANTDGKKSEPLDGKELSTYPPLAEQSINLQKDIGFPNRDRHAFHKRMRKVLSPPLKALEFSTDTIGGLMFGQDVDRENISNANLEKSIHNTLFYYRSFDRLDKENDKGRAYDKESGGYPYNVRVLVPDSRGKLEGEDTVGPLEYLEFLKWEYEHNPGSYSLATESGHSNRIKRRLYRDFYKKEDARKLGANSKLVRTLTAAADIWFWYTLRKDSGVYILNDLLKTPVGNHSRSMVDSCLNDGLFHFDTIFDAGGINRLDTSLLSNSTTKYILSQRKNGLKNDDLASALRVMRSLPVSLRRDLKRIVIFYYIFVGMASGSLSGTNPEPQYDIRDVTAMFLPVSFLDSPIGALVHACFRSEGFHLERHIWMHNFFLMTLQYEEARSSIDRALWGNLENRVIRLLSKIMGNVTNRLELLKAIPEINAKLLQEQRYVPYALPQYKLVSRANESDETHYPVAVDMTDHARTASNNPKTELHLRWKIVENPLFIGRQNWNGKGTRTFHYASEIGMSRGIRMMRLEKS